MKTVEEMRKDIKKYCDSLDDCVTCPLRDRSGWCYSRDYLDDETIKEHYRLIFESNNVNHPKHYQGKHECIDEMIAMFGVEAVKHFCMCNVYKYRYRAAAKNGQEDLDKADWYMDKLMELGGVNCDLCEDGERRVRGFST